MAADTRLMRNVEEYLASVLAAVRLVDAVSMPLGAALGRTLREPVIAQTDIPRFDNSAMDGFAVRFDDVSDAVGDSPAILRVVADLPAGIDLDPPLGPGQAARIMTGSPVPSDADAIVPFEDTAGGLADSLGMVHVLAAPPRRGMHIRRRGEDIHDGTELLPACVALGPLQLGAAAAANVADVVVSRRPRVAVISTGSELVAPGGLLRRGQIPESNSTLLAAAAAEAGAEVVLQTSVPDDSDQLTRALADASALGADAVIMSGGVSAGAYEVVKGTLTHMQFSSVAMQPGKPQGFAAGHPMLFGLPGNPVSVAVSFEVFVRPALLAMQGRAMVHRRVLPLPVRDGWRTPPERRQYLPVIVEEGGVRPATSGGSHQAGGVARAEAYAIVPADLAAVASGDVVDVMLIT